MCMCNDVVVCAVLRLNILMLYVHSATAADMLNCTFCLLKTFCIAGTRTMEVDK